VLVNGEGGRFAAPSSQDVIVGTTPVTAGPRAIACEPMTGRLRHALVVGLRAVVLTAFANAAVVVVIAAALHDVNHVHEDDAPEHVHALSEVFGPAASAVPAAPLAGRDAVVRMLREAPAAAHVPTRARSDCGVRDPPAGSTA
jgi:hypothetical protein